MTPDTFTLWQGDCLELMQHIPDGSIDAVICDPPYGTTACKWDSVIPFEPMWNHLHRLIKPNGAIALFGAEPFSSMLRVSNIENFKYDWVWKKSKTANFAHAKNMPINFHEIVSLFSLGSIGHAKLVNNRMVYNPQGLQKSNTVWKRNKKYETEHNLTRKSHKLTRIIEFTNYPNSVIEFNNSNNNERGSHPTQKPVPLMEYLIKTYTNAGETVLDFTMGSGTTGVACINTGRKFIGIEKEQKYFDIATRRIFSAYNQAMFEPGDLFYNYGAK